MSEELEVLKAVARQLTDAGIPYMVTGSIAANFYAVPRMTRDIDIVVDVSESDIDRLIGIFRDEFYIDRDTVQEAVRTKGMFNVIHNAYVIKVDFVIRKDSDYRRTEFSRRKGVSLEGCDLFLVAPEDLIISKLDWARESHSEVQLSDVRNLLARVEGLDHTYLMQWISRLGLESLYQEIRG